MSVRLNQCKACPWKKSTKPTEDIRGGYCETRHKGLAQTIAEPGSLAGLGRMHAMACHESPPGAEQACVGWVANQLGPGNNIALRLMARDGRYRNLKLDGPQLERFEDTLPRKRRAHKRKGSEPSGAAPSRPQIDSRRSSVLVGHTTRAEGPKARRS